MTLYIHYSNFINIMFPLYTFIIPLKGRPYEKVPGIISKISYINGKTYIHVWNLFGHYEYYSAEDIQSWDYPSPKLNEMKEELQRLSLQQNYIKIDS